MTDKLTNFLKVLLISSILPAGAGVLSGWQEYQLLASSQRGMKISAAEADSNDVRQAMIGFLQLGLFALTGIIFLNWIHRANANTRSRAAKGMGFTPGWAVKNYYFIPIVILWKPYQAKILISFG